MTNTVNTPELAARHGKKTNLRYSAYRLTTEDLNALLQAQLTMALLSKLIHDVMRDGMITPDEITAVACYANAISEKRCMTHLLKNCARF